jgi:hypothetical protein
MEERRAQPGFDVAKLVADGRLCEVQALCGTRHAAEGGHLADQAQVTNFELHDV